MNNQLTPHLKLRLAYIQIQVEKAKQQQTQQLIARSGERETAGT